MTMDINVMQSLSQDKSSQVVDEVLGMHNHNLTITIRAYFITCRFFFKLPTDASFSHKIVICGAICPLAY